LAGKVRVFAGQNEISLECLESAIDTLRAREHVLLTKVSSFDHDLWEFYLRNLGIMSDMVQFRSSALRVGNQRATLLHRCCCLLIDHNCSDVRDKVYAALGLANNDLAFKPDYSFCFAKVILDMSRKSLLAGDFSVLHYADTSWKNAARSTRPSFVALLRNNSLKLRPLPLGGNEFPVYTADISRLSTVQTFGQSSIKIQRVRIDEVPHVDTLAHLICDLAVRWGIPIRLELLNIYRHVEALQNRLPSDAFKLAFWRTVNLGFCEVREDMPCYEKVLTLGSWTCLTEKILLGAPKTGLSMLPSWSILAWGLGGRQSMIKLSYLMGLRYHSSCGKRQRILVRKGGNSSGTVMLMVGWTEDITVMRFWTIRTSLTIRTNTAIPGDRMKLRVAAHI
jgi:hypothetical protein